MFRELEQNENGKQNQRRVINFNHLRRGSPQEPSEASPLSKKGESGALGVPATSVKYNIPPPLPTFPTATFTDLETNLLTVAVDGRRRPKVPSPPVHHNEAEIKFGEKTVKGRENCEEARKRNATEMNLFSRRSAASD